MTKKNGSGSRYTFECHYTDEQGNGMSWEGKWNVVDAHGGSIEMTVTARGFSYWLIVGEYTDGYYVCIPEWNAGSALGYLDDLHWNYGRLSRSMSPCDAMSVVAGLRDFARTTGWGIRE